MNDSQKHDGFNAVSVSERKRWKIADLTSSVGAGVLGAGIGMLLPAETQAWAIGVLLAGGALHVWACSTNIGLNRRRHADLPRQRLSGASCARGAGRAHHRYKNAASCTAPSSAYAPKLITVAASMAVLLPIMWVAGAGSEIMQRIAVPMVGGMVSSTVVTLIVIPAIYSLLKGAAATRRAVDRKALTLTNPEANAATW